MSPEYKQQWTHAGLDWMIHQWFIHFIISELLAQPTLHAIQYEALLASVSHSLCISFQNISKTWQFTYLYIGIHIETVVLCTDSKLLIICALCLVHFCLHTNLSWIACSIYPFFTVQLCVKRKQKKNVHMQTWVCECADTGRSATASIQSCYWLDWIGLNAIKCRYDMQCTHTLLILMALLITHGLIKHFSA